jgi:hypothetical protein
MKLVAERALQTTAAQPVDSSLRSISFRFTATLIVCTSSAYTPAPPSRRLNFTSAVGSHACRCSQ